MEDDSRPHSHLLHQCREARHAAQNVQVTTIIRDQTGVNYNTKTVKQARVGGVLEDDMDFSRTFHGARMTKGNTQVCECMSSSFDPANLSCLMCSEEHNILDSSRPSTIVLTDHCFVGNLSGDKNNCVSLVKIENSTLHELVDIAFEIFDGKTIPAGSVIMVGAGSHLYRVGASAYAWDWVQCVGRLAARWKSVNICPIFPIITADSPGSLYRDIGQLAVWLSQVYDSSTRGLADVWALLVRLSDVSCVGEVLLPVLDTVKLSMPATLMGGESRTYTFEYNSSCPANLTKIDRKATEELVRALIAALNRDFSIQLDPEKILGREPEQCTDAKHTYNVVVIGASNLGRIVPLMQGAGLSVTDLTQPGWVATQNELRLLGDRLHALPPGKKIFVAEFFSNSCIRFAQVDGTLCLPMKLGHNYHLPGAVGVLDPGAFKKLADPVIDLLRGVQDPKIIIPPLPRYINTPCCSAPDHCSNFKGADYASGQLEQLTGLRTSLKDSMLKGGVQNFRLLDGIGAIAGFMPPDPRPGNAECVPHVSRVLSRDGVHLNELGQKNFVRALTKTLADYKKDTAAVVFSGPKGAAHYWRGFLSPVGSAHIAGSKQHRFPKKALHHMTPYSKKN